MTGLRQAGSAALVALALMAGGCQAIKDKRGYLADSTLMQSVQPGIDNMQSVEKTLGRPTFTSEYGQPTWYYVSSTTSRKPFNSPNIKEHNVFAVNFDAAGNVLSIDQTGMDKVAKLDPDGDKTPTLGRERTFLEDLFGNIGAVGSGGGGGAGN